MNHINSNNYNNYPTLNSIDYNNYPTVNSNNYNNYPTVNTNYNNYPSVSSNYNNSYPTVNSNYYNNIYNLNPQNLNTPRFPLPNPVLSLPRAHKPQGFQLPLLPFQNRFNRFSDRHPPLRRLSFLAILPSPPLNILREDRTTWRRGKDFLLKNIAISKQSISTTKRLIPKRRRARKN